MIVFERLIAKGRLLMSRIEKQAKHGVDSLPEDKRVITGEVEGWFAAAATAIDQEFGSESQEALNYRRAMDAESVRVRECIRKGYKSSHGDWGVWLIGFAIGLVAPYEYRPEQEGEELRDRNLPTRSFSIGPIKEFHIGDKYSASRMTFQQLWDRQTAATDLPSLVKELEALRETMKGDAISKEHDVAIGEVAAAQDAASEGDGPKALQHLKNAGKWALDIAIKIGVNVAARVIEAAMDLP